MFLNLAEIIKTFLQIGVSAFGGPAAHIAVMELEIVEKRQWMNKQQFTDLVGATSIIPGPNSSEMAMHCGYARGGVPGLFAAGLAFILPAILLTALVGHLYASYGHLPALENWIAGIKPAMITLILLAVNKLRKKALSNIELTVVALFVIIAYLFGISELVCLFGAGLYGITRSLVSSTSLKAVFAPAILVIPAITHISASSIFLTFLKIGSILFGSGYVLFAYLEGELIHTKAWLTYSQLAEAIAVGNLTPGPVLSTSTFVGFQLNGIWGAIAATGGIFLPSFAFVLILTPIVPKIRKSALATGFLNAVNAAALALMFGAAVNLSKAVLIDWQTAIIFELSAIFVFGFKKVNPFLLIAASSLTGFILYSI